MATIKEIIDHIENFAPLSLQGDFDNCGLKIGDVFCEVSGILVTLDTNESVVEEAINKKCNLIIEHHPSIFRPIKKIDYDLPLSKSLTLALKNDIAVYSAHTNVDFCENGLNDFVAKQIGLQNISKCGEIGDPRIGELKEETTLKDYSLQLKKIFADNNVKTIGDLNKKIRKVAVINGGGGRSEQDLLCAYYSGADVYVTGDVKYNVARLAKDINYAIIEVGHYNSEQGFMPLICNKLKEKYKNIGIYQATSLLNPYN